MPRDTFPLPRASCAVAVLRRRGGDDAPIRALLWDRSTALVPEYDFVEEAAHRREDELVIGARLDGSTVAYRVDPLTVDLLRYRTGALIAVVRFDPPVPFAPCYDGGRDKAAEAFDPLHLGMRATGADQGDARRRQFWRRAVQGGLVDEALTEARLAKAVALFDQRLGQVHHPVVVAHDETVDEQEQGRGWLPPSWFP